MRAFLVVLAVLVGGVVAVGFSRDWFQLTVNKGKMKEDTDRAKQKVEELGKRSGDRDEEAVEKARGARTATGRVKKVEAADSRFLMTTGDNEQLTMYTGPSSRLPRNDQDVKLEQLQPHDEVEVGYDLEDGKNLVAFVTVHRQ